MAFDFPNAPTLGQVYQGYTWDGEKWAYTAGGTGPTGIAGPTGVTGTTGTTGPTGPVVVSPDIISGIQINGAMEVNQFNVVGNYIAIPQNVATYAIDQWVVACSSSATMRAMQNNAPNSTPTGIYSLSLLPSAPQTMGAGDVTHLFQPVEGTRWRRLNWSQFLSGAVTPASLTIGFWVQCNAGNVSRTFSVAVRNAAGNRSYVTNVTINAPVTWEYKTVTIPPDTGATWVSDNTLAAFVSFVFGCGTTWQTTANTWQAGNFLGTSANQNFFTNSGDNVAITGVVMLAGTIAPTAAQSVNIRSYAEELMLCQRYFWTWSGNYGVRLLNAYADQTTTAQGIIYTPVPMRIPNPTTTVTNMTFNGVAITAANIQATNNPYSNTYSYSFTSSGMVAGSMYQMYGASNNLGSVRLDARM
jgi:hypothetical protein